MIHNYNFEKNIFKNGNIFSIEITIPENYNKFLYKIYGSSGFCNNGSYNSYTNLNGNITNNLFPHKIIINIDKIQNIFINIIVNKNEYYDFIDMSNELNKKYSYLEFYL